MTNANTSDALPVNRTFKSTLFIMLFEDKKNLLELYNAITGKHYADPELDNRRQHGCSFLIEAGWRHQSKMLNASGTVKSVRS